MLLKLLRISAQYSSTRIAETKMLQVIFNELPEEIRCCDGEDEGTQIWLESG